MGAARADARPIDARERLLELRWLYIRQKLRLARDWRTEAQLRFELIDADWELTRYRRLALRPAASTGA